MGGTEVRDEPMSAADDIASPDVFRDVLDFHRKFRPYMIGTTPAEPGPDAQHFRWKLIDEEIKELWQAMDDGDLPGVADGIVDSIYVLIGCAVSYGIDLCPVWEAVHAANLKKDGGPTRSDGKVLKPEGWEPPDIKGILERQKPLD